MNIQELYSNVLDEALDIVIQIADNEKELFKNSSKYPQEKYFKRRYMYIRRLEYWMKRIIWLRKKTKLFWGLKDETVDELTLYLDVDGRHYTKPELISIYGNLQDYTDIGE